MQIKRWYNKGNMGEDQVAGEWVRYKDVLESQKLTTNTESMPCVVGVRGEVCRLGFGGKCGAPVCQLMRTAHIS